MEESILFELPADANFQVPDPGMLQLYKDFNERIYWLNAEITSGYLDLVSKIMDWNREDRGKPIEDRKEIKIFIYSPGGDLEAARTIINVIKISRTPIIGIAMGEVASAASMIYLACHVKIALPNARFLFHKGSISGLSGNYEEVARAMTDYDRTIKELVEFYVKFTKFPEDVVRSNLQQGDWYIYNDEALQNGVVDKVIDDIEEIL